MNGVGQKEKLSRQCTVTKCRSTVQPLSPPLSTPQLLSSVTFPSACTLPICMHAVVDVFCITVTSHGASTTIIYQTVLTTVFHVLHWHRPHNRQSWKHGDTPPRTCPRRFTSCTYLPLISPRNHLRKKRRQNLPCTILSFEFPLRPPTQAKRLYLTIVSSLRGVGVPENNCA